MIRLLASLLACWLLPAALYSQKNADAEMDSLRLAYILRYCDIAMDEMERTGIPASIKLAQALLETRAGTSELAQKANNHFGIKCGKNWAGETYAKNDDEVDAKGRPVLSCFRKYPNVAASYADHSAFLLNPEKKYRYGFLFELSPLDYRAWAEGLQKAGYSPVSHYAERLIFYIERHRLNEYDQWVHSGRVALKRVALVNGARMVQAREGETLRRIAEVYQVPADSLVVFNEGLYALDKPLHLGDPVFIERKATAAGSDAPMVHRASQGETLRHIAQRYGIQAQAIRRYNPVLPDTALAANTLVYLRPAPEIEQKPMLGIKGTKPKREASALEQPSMVVEMLPTTPLAEPVPVSPMPVEVPKVPATTTIDMQTGAVETYHTVSPGDTLYGIARRYQTSVERLRQINPNIAEPLRPGQTLRVQ